MLTYDMDSREGRSRYEHLYRCIAQDIRTGVIAAGEKLPSKRELASHLGVSVVTVEGAYRQLDAEGYIEARERKGYFVCELPERVELAHGEETSSLKDEPWAEAPDHSRSATAFPQGVWARHMRAVLSAETSESLSKEMSPAGSHRLRAALCEYLRESRGMHVEPEQLVVGAGAQYLYNLVIQLLGRPEVVAVEDPGYTRLTRIYQANGLSVAHIPLDEGGIQMGALLASGASMVHVMPSHQYPTGLVTSVARRYELLSWAAQDEKRIIFEDDYDCEFRLAGRPIEPLANIDTRGQVIYVNTFTKSMGPGFRVGYLVLPPRLARQFAQTMDFYSCTVPVMDQLALASFIASGDYERHVNRMRNRCRGVRDALLPAIKAIGGVSVRGEDAGLHFLLEARDTKVIEKLVDAARGTGLVLHPIDGDSEGRYVVAYEGMTAEDVERLAKTLQI